MLYQIKVTLTGSKPPIWRRLLVPGAYTLGDLHQLLQVVFGWEHAHMHQFIVGALHFGEPSPHDWDPVEDEDKVRVEQVLGAVKDSITYEYDFGDSWRHKITVEKVLEEPEEGASASCVAGRRAGPPEDCGGIWGYENLLAIQADPSHPEHEERMEWYGEPIDPAFFDLAEVARAVRSLAATMDRAATGKPRARRASKRPKGRA
ncbi:MAG: plasmid pRiA4b ORF-3 family protein [Deltaproteobacteria bacterium]|nr:plasmid pRiA4b ORF-3 family protein [Deltaproteobacteria bacterium]